MQIEFVPLLQKARDLHDVPRGMERFGAYIQTITGGNDSLDLVPLVAMNPMGREHVAERLDQWIALDAEQIAAQAALEAARELHKNTDVFKLGLVISDDLRGGWTNRYTSDWNVRFSKPANIVGRWISVVLWVSEEASAALLQARVRTAIYRTVYTLKHGPARTLRDMLRQEGAVERWGGASPPPLSAEEVDYARAVIAPHHAATEWPVVLPCLYGDPAAYALGYPQLGLPEFAGFAVAHADAAAMTEPLADAQAASPGVPKDHR